MIDDYVASVRLAVDALSSLGVTMPSSNNDWAHYELPDNLNAPHGIRIQKHGYGCRFKSDQVYVDFDFGEHGEIDGFDCWRLYDFCGAELSTKYGFASKADLKQVFENACKANELRYSGYILWYCQAPL